MSLSARRAIAALAGGVSLALLGACSTGRSSAASPKPAATSGSESTLRVLEAVVIEREYDPPGAPGGGSYRGSGSWYLSFEAEDGDKTVHYRFPVSKTQYNRCPEGSRVRLVLDGDLLRDIRPTSER